MKEITLQTHLQGLASPAKAPHTETAGGFAEVFKDAVAEVNKAQIEGDRAVEKLHSGEAKNLHEVMITMEEADISLRLMVQMRNKILEAYQEIMRMQV